jgi:hypothetical protein
MYVCVYIVLCNVPCCVLFQCVGARRVTLVLCVLFCKSDDGTPSFGGEVKPSVPCPTLRHVKETKSDVEVAIFCKILSAISRP